MLAHRATAGNKPDSCRRARPLVPGGQFRRDHAHRQCPAPPDETEPAGCWSTHLKYLRYWRISASLRFWLGIGRLLYSLSICLASGSDWSIASGALSHIASHRSVRRFVTPARSGPSFFPPPMAWHARHLLWNSSCPFTASGSVGVAATAGML